MNNAQDLDIKVDNTIMEKPPVEEIKEDGEALVSSANNKFFNFLENEAANMNMDYIPPSNDVEVLDIDMNPAPKEEKQEEDIMPFVFDNQPGNNTISTIEPVNTIEDITKLKDDVTIDPMDAVARLNPDYEKVIKEETGTDLKTAINEIRDFVSSLQERGFEISLEELDLNDTYQINLNIKKQETDK